MKVVRSILEMREIAAQLRAEGKIIGFVPTMGCLHKGHFALVDALAGRCHFRAVSIFVNPTQFGPNEDFEKYPRAEKEDLASLEIHGTDLVFLPDAAEFYPKNFSTFVNEELCSQGLCGAFRAGHFRGVATVVLMLFNIVQPHIAAFGHKDAQQVAVLKKMISDLFVPVKILEVPTVREADGLALSSRNRYLTAEQRVLAPKIQTTLRAAKEKILRGENDTGAIREFLENEFAKIPEFRAQYIAIVNAETMAPIEKILPQKTLIAVAVILGETRLIDNIDL